MNVPDDEPIRIAGSGPAGLAAAIELAQRGYPVEVHERRDRAGGRFSGGHQILAHYGERPRAVQLLRSMGIDVTRLEGRWLDRARFHTVAGRHRDFSGRSPFAYLLRRGPQARALDGALVQRALELGVTIQEEHRLAEDAAQIVATGPARVDGMALEILYEIDAANRVDVLLDPERFAGGYAYLLVHDHLATLGVAALGQYDGLESMAEHALERLGADITSRAEERSRAKHTMCYGVPPRASQGGVFRVGEAAGFQDFLFGLGIRNALLSGTLAAHCVQSGEDFDRQWRRAMRSRMRASEVDRWLYERGWLGWLLLRSPTHRLDRSLDWLHRGSRWRAPLAAWLGRK